MRCQACDKNLNDRESTRRSSSTSEFLDLCDGCFAEIANEVPTTEVDVSDCGCDEGNDEDAIDD